MNLGMKLGELIDVLEDLPPKAEIVIDFGGAVPTVLDSYRGYYDQLALGYNGDYNKGITVGELLKDAQEAVGKTFTGWKGGDYVMSRATYIFVANPGNTSDTYIETIRKKYDNWYEIVTKEETDD